MPDTRTDKRFDFAVRHFKGVFDTLNAGAAIYRAEQLVEEIRKLKVLLPESRFEEYGRPVEFPSYYLVGFVTCLEWHARSRLYDLLRYDPKNFTGDDVKQAAAGSKLEELLREQLTVAQLVAASTLVSEFEKYLSIFNRILVYLGVNKNASDIAKEGSDDAGRTFNDFQNLFVRRHLLIHEVDQTQVGHWNLRETVSLDEAEKLGLAVIGLMNRLEHSISAAAKGDFPNLIYPDSYISRLDRLAAMIKEVEDEIVDAMSNNKEVGLDVPKFLQSLQSSRDHIVTEHSVLVNMSYPGRQYYELYTPLLNMIYENRLAYVLRLKKELYEGSVV